MDAAPNPPVQSVGTVTRPRDGYSIRGGGREPTDFESWNLVFSQKVVFSDSESDLSSPTLGSWKHGCPQNLRKELVNRIEISNPGKDFDEFCKRNSVAARLTVFVYLIRNCLVSASSNVQR